MSLLNFTGWEAGEATDATLSGTASYQGTTKHTGAYALRCNPTTTGTGFATWRGISSTVFNAANFNDATLYHAFYFYYSTKPAVNSEEIFVARDTAAGNKFGVRLNSTGTLSAYDKTLTNLLSTGATVLNSGTWYLLEIKVGTGAAAAWEVKINGVSEISGTGDLGTTNNGDVRFGKTTNRNSQSVDFYFDNCATDNAAYPGAGVVAVLLPNGDGTFTSGTGTYADVDEIPNDGDSTTIAPALGVGNARSVTLQDCATVGISGTIQAAKITAYNKRSGASNGSLKLRYYIGGTSYDTAGVAVGSTYQLYSYLLETNPSTGAAWTSAGIDGAEIGVVCNNASFGFQCTQLLLMVRYRPSSGGLLLLKRREVLQ